MTVLLYEPDGTSKLMAVPWNDRRAEIRCLEAINNWKMEPENLALSVKTISYRFRWMIEGVGIYDRA